MRRGDCGRKKKDDRQAAQSRLQKNRAERGGCDDLDRPLTF